MLLKTILIILIVASSFVLVTGQKPDAKKSGASDPAKTSGVNRSQKLRDLPFPGGVDLRFLIKELAKDLDINVLFDPESRLENRKVIIELRSVTTTAALDYVLLQEGLYFEEAGPRTILIASRMSGRWVASIGVAVLAMSPQLAQFFGVTGGILIDYIREDSPASKGGLKPGDVIVGIDGVAVHGALGLTRAIDDQTKSDVTLTIVRDRESRTISVTPQKGIQAVL